MRGPMVTWKAAKEGTKTAMSKSFVLPEIQPSIITSERKQIKQNIKEQPLAHCELWQLANWAKQSDKGLTAKSLVESKARTSHGWVGKGRRTAAQRGGAWTGSTNHRQDDSPSRQRNVQLTSQTIVDNFPQPYLWRQEHPKLYLNLSNPKPGHTTGGWVRGNAKRGGRAGRAHINICIYIYIYIYVYTYIYIYIYIHAHIYDQEGLDADGSVRRGHNHPSCPQGHRGQLSWAFSWKYEQRTIYVNRWVKNTSFWQLVYQQNDSHVLFLAADQSTIFVFVNTFRASHCW